MDDIIEKLEFVSESLGHGLCGQAAAEITRLRRENATECSTNRRLRDEATELQRANSALANAVDETRALRDKQVDEITTLRAHKASLNEAVSRIAGHRDRLIADLVNSLAHKDEVISSLNFRIRDLTLVDNDICYRASYEDTAKMLAAARKEVENLRRALDEAQKTPWRLRAESAEDKLERAHAVMVGSDRIQSLAAEQRQAGMAQGGGVFGGTIVSGQALLQNASRGTPACVAACMNCTCGKGVL